MALSENPVQNKLASQTIDYWKILRIVLSRWYWIATAVIIAYILAAVYIKYTQPIYITYASLKLDNGEQSQLGIPSPLSYRLRSNLIESEGIIMRSPGVILKAVESLNYKISYFLEGRLRTSEVYPNIPFEINIIKQDSLDFSRNIYRVKPVNIKRFQLSNDDGKSWKPYTYGSKIEMGNMVFSVVTPIPSRGSYSFRFNSSEDFIGRASGGLNYQEQEKNTNIMQVSHTDKNPTFSADVLNAIIRQYVQNDADEKKRSAIQTIEYLDTQFQFLDANSNKSGDILSEYQTNNNLIDPATDKQLGTGKVSEFTSQIADARLKQYNIEQLDLYVRNSRGNNPLNLDLQGISEGSVLSAVAERYNGLLLERAEKLQDLTPSSTIIKDYDQRINDAKQSILQGIKSLIDRNRQFINSLEKQLGNASRNLSQIPRKINDFSKLSANLEVNNQLRNLILEKKFSAQITKAAVIPGAKIISLASPSLTPITPVKRSIYLNAILLGLTAGFGMILLIRLVNPYIYDVETVEGLTTTPIIGVILKYPEKIENDLKRILSIDKPKSVFAESVRSVRTNLSFMASQQANKVICVTSEISGEGKSFVTVNLAGTLAIIEKKVIVVAADLRRSKLHKTFGTNNKHGLSTYLSSKDAIDDIIRTDKLHNIDFITSGPVPPNPSELLHSSRMTELIERLKQTYEYIIIDTAPVGLVSDSIPLIRSADINLFIIRSGISKFRAASIPERLSKEYSLSNIAIILNSFGNEKLHANIYSTNYTHGNAGAYYYSDYTGYGNYGYYDDEGSKKWWQIWRK